METPSEITQKVAQPVCFWSLTVVRRFEIKAKAVRRWLPAFQVSASPAIY
jgi:hypothetical protein